MALQLWESLPSAGGQRATPGVSSGEGRVGAEQKEGKLRNLLRVYGTKNTIGRFVPVPDRPAGAASNSHWANLLYLRPLSASGGLVSLPGEITLTVPAPASTIELLREVSGPGTGLRHLPITDLLPTSVRKTPMGV